MSRIHALALAFVVCLGTGTSLAGTLESVKARGHLVCGSNVGLAGFGLQDDHGTWMGFDIDFCRAVAAAIFGDASKVQFVPLTSKDRFTALQSGEIDLLARNTTWTLSREAGQGLLFAAITYFDGQGFAVRKAQNIGSALDLSEASICVQQGTTTELNLADFFRANNLKYEPVVFATADDAVRAYESARCDAYTTDASGLYVELRKLAQPDDHIVLPEVISKEPLGPVVRQGDDQWFNIVKWVAFALVDAEELGISAKNVDEKAKSEVPDVKRLLGFEGDFGEALGLGPDWAYRIVKLVGNYGEIFDRNLGDGSKLKIKRGINALWTRGGLHYAPPVR
jgi:general L-amino acid transport system substrate-binding protein